MILEEVYPALRRYLAYTVSRADTDGLVSHGLGDWISVNPKHMPSVTFTSSCYYYQAQRIAAEIAKMKGNGLESAAYDAAARRTREGLRRRFKQPDGVWDNGGQTAQGMALAFGLVEVSEPAAAERLLVASVERTDGHVDMELLGMKHVFHALSRVGRTDLAWKMLTNPTSPSPVAWIKKRGTTLWEDWDDGFSRNHVMFGDFVGWAYQYMAGIHLKDTEDSTSAVTIPTSPAFHRVLIEPVFLPGLQDLKASIDLALGGLSVAWHRTGSEIQVEINIPEGVKAQLKLPGMGKGFVQLAVRAGRFSCETEMRS